MKLTLIQLTALTLLVSCGSSEDKENSTSETLNTVRFETANRIDASGTQFDKYPFSNGKDFSSEQLSSSWYKSEVTATLGSLGSCSITTEDSQKFNCTWSMIQNIDGTANSLYIRVGYSENNGTLFSPIIPLPIVNCSDYSDTLNGSYQNCAYQFEIVGSEFTKSENLQDYTNLEMNRPFSDSDGSTVDTSSGSIE